MEEYDVIVAGSGAAGMVTAMRAHDLGLSVLILERAHKFGGTSATSGGVLWMPMHGLGGFDDSRELAMEYIEAVSEGPVRRDRQEAFVDTTAEMARYLIEKGVALQPRLWPDYFQRAPGARMDRCLVHPKVDGYRLGDKFHLLREQFTRFKLFNRYSMDFDEANTIASRGPGWVRTVGKVIGRYWVDRPARKKSKRDRWLSLGGALMGALSEQVIKRGIEIRLGTTVDKLVTRDGAVVGVEANRSGQRYPITAKKGVVICAGGFEKNQRLRDKFLTVPGTDRWSSTPDDGSWGEALEAAMEVGAATEFTETTWMIPTMIMPMPNVSN